MILCRLIYASKRDVRTALNVHDLVRVSRKNNAASGVTGFLFFDENCFIQALEGSREDVSVTYNRIARDPRHRDVVLMSCEEISVRKFPYWSMGLHEGMDHATRTYLLEAFSLRQLDLSSLSADSLLQFLLRLAKITRKLDELNAMMTLKC